MKSISRFYVVTLLSFLNFSAANAHFSASRCLVESWIPVSSRSTSGPCFVSEPLKLATTEKKYPFLSGETFQVQYWEGVYSKVVEYTTNYRHEIYDECSRRTLLKEIVPAKESLQVAFRIENENLGADIDATYKLVPLTNKEAYSEFQKALLQCQK